jgi:hypothetical protein
MVVMVYLPLERVGVHGETMKTTWAGCHAKEGFEYDEKNLTVFRAEGFVEAGVVRGGEPRLGHQGNGAHQEFIEERHGGILVASAEVGEHNGEDFGGQGSVATSETDALELALLCHLGDHLSREKKRKKRKKKTERLRERERERNFDLVRS